mmetsp:Transcript_3487/g.5312  ORF Transcript_3487/g.5312 Transcript_3487/m.5312 type:complete len:644 (-) Transcript_3487:1271-3202(-)
MIPRIFLFLLLTLLDCYHAAAITWTNNNNITMSATFPYHRRFLSSKYRDDMMDILGQRRDVTVEVPTSPEDHLVTNLPLLKDEDAQKLQQYAGLLPASNQNDKYFFYWYFFADSSVHQEQHKDEDIPLVIWLNGGPGCSSMDGLFLENGPLEFAVGDDGNYALTLRESSWHKGPAYMVYVDQPVGTGLSFTTSRNYPKNDEQVNTDFFSWFQNFLTLHQDSLLADKNGKNMVHRPIYFSGESHAGHYIPSMMAYILKQKNPKWQIHLKGAAIGNGWVDPYHQYAAAEAAYGHGIIDRAQKNALDIQEQACQAELKKGVYYSKTCLNLLDDIVSQSHGSSVRSRVSQYDIRKVEGGGGGGRTFPPGHDLVESYLGGRSSPMKNVNFKEVLEALHSTPSLESGQHYQECTDPPYTALAHQDGLGVTDDVAFLLKSGTVRMLFFNGIMDLICNHVGNEITLEQLHWKNQEDWTKAERYAWMTTFDNREAFVAGYVKEFGNLIYLKVLEAGHMVPMDQPEVSMEMMHTFLYSNSFDSSKQTLKRSLEPDGRDACPTQQEIANVLTNNNDNSHLSIDNSVVWGASAGILILVVVLCFALRRRERQTEQEIREHLSMVELSSQYRDDFDGGYSDSEDEEEITKGRNGVV